MTKYPRRQPRRCTALALVLLLQTIAICFMCFRIEILYQAIITSNPRAFVTAPRSDKSRGSQPSPTIARRVNYAGTAFDTLSVDLQKLPIRLYFRDPSAKRFSDFIHLREYLKRQHRNLIFATNAGMFTPSHEPLGFYVEDGRELYPLNTQKGSGNFYTKPNGVFITTDRGAFVVDPEAFVDLQRFIKVSQGTQSGPLLLQNGTIPKSIRPDSISKYIRSGVGIINPYTVVFVISDEPVTFNVLASLFKDYFHCRDALYLDGAISQMYLPELGRYDSGSDFSAMIAIAAEEMPPDTVK